MDDEVVEIEEGEAQTLRIKGEIIRLSTRTWGDGWGYGTLRSGRKEVNFAGTIGDITVGMCVVITGVWEESKYGARLKIHTLVPDLPASQEGVEAWLMHRLPQIGPIRAQDIAHHFGAELWNVLDDDPLRLTVINGITDARARDIHDAYITFKDEREAFVDFFSMGFTKEEAQRAFRRIGSGAHVYVRANPYILYLDHSFSFSRIEVLANALGIEPRFGPRLVSAVVESARREAFDSGDTIFTEDELLTGAAQIVEDTTINTHLRAALSQCLFDQRIRRFGASYMLAEHYAAEELIAKKIKELVRRD